MLSNPRFLGIDYGRSRIGLAVSDPLGLTAQGLKYIKNNADIWTNFEKLFSEYEFKAVVLGLPKTLKGTESDMTKEVRKFEEAFKKRFNVDIIFRDERLSSKAAESHLISMDVRRDKRKEKIDSMAAAFFLQGYLDEL